MYTMYVSGANRGQKSALEPLELELQMVTRHHMGVGDPGPLKERWVLVTVKPSPPT